MKKFTVTFTEDDDGNITCFSENEGFNVAELIALTCTKYENLMEQMMHPERFEAEGIYTSEDGTKKFCKRKKKEKKK
jgi:hypothetical protein